MPPDRKAFFPCLTGEGGRQTFLHTRGGGYRVYGGTNISTGRGEGTNISSWRWQDGARLIMIANPANPMTI